MFNNKEYEKALQEKGFKKDRKTGHKVYYLWDGDKKTNIHTMISHGAREDIGDILARKLQRQLRLDRKKELREFVDCPLTHDGYISFLKQKGEI